MQPVAKVGAVPLVDASDVRLLWILDFSGFQGSYCSLLETDPMDFSLMWRLRVKGMVPWVAIHSLLHKYHSWVGCEMDHLLPSESNLGDFMTGYTVQFKLRCVTSSRSKDQEQAYNLILAGLLGICYFQS
ncbi:hypothetical protein Taro_035197 [Colocasia esculenta]|uniref:Uncharacterized protein n=1 Tax=Colocasia esculenta TaxID=4460 RepID=A0A843VYD4_COLES|nr:hypothetical protein [Colocasia esculenta]